MAGVIPLLGFVAKEAAFDVLIADADWYALFVIAGASVLTVSYTARFWFGAFTTKVGVDAIERAPVGLGMTVPPTILAVLSLGLGLFPKGLGTLISSAAGEVTKLVLWPGLKPALAVSAAVLVAGSGLFALQRNLERTPNRRLIPQWPFSTATSWYLASLRILNNTAERTTGIVQNGSLPVYVAVIVTTVVSIPAVVWLAGADSIPELRITNGPAEVILVVVAIAGAVAATRAQRRMAAALLLGVVGYAVSGIYIVFGAPDLALTQLLIETLTIALFALVLAKLPRRFGADPRSLSRSIRIGVSVLVGVVIAGAAALANTGSPDRTVAEAYIELAPEAGGRNVVNIILTNFRALDTLGEITVLAAAAVGIAALVGARSRNQDREDAR
jgi:multicomponent Na+:H+ antiporter subunit A